MLENVNEITSSPKQLVRYCNLGSINWKYNEIFIEIRFLIVVIERMFVFCDCRPNDD